MLHAALRLEEQHRRQSTDSNGLDSLSNSERHAVNLIVPFKERALELHLEPAEMIRLSCETLILCMPAALYELSERESRTLNSMLTSLLGDDGHPASLSSQLRLEGYDEPGLQELQPYLHYRLLLLIQKRPADFSSPVHFQLWGERQLAMLFNGLLGVMRTSWAAAPPGTFSHLAAQPPAGSDPNPVVGCMTCGVNGASSAGGGGSGSSASSGRVGGGSWYGDAKSTSHEAARDGLGADPPRMMQLVGELRGLCEKVRAQLRRHGPLVAHTRRQQLSEEMETEFRVVQVQSCYALLRREDVS